MADGMNNPLSDAPVSPSSTDLKVDPARAHKDADELRRLKGQFIEDFGAEEKWRSARREYGRFYDGDQLTTEELRELELRGQPPVVINRVKPKIDAILGIIQELAVETKAFPLGDRENEATEISERFRRIENDSHFNEEELLVAKDVMIDGLGYFKTRKEWDGLESRTITEHIPNHFVVSDKYARRADGRDSKRRHEHVWMDLEDAKLLFSNSAEELEAGAQGPDLWAKLLQEALSQYRPDQYQQKGGSVPWTEMATDFQQFVDPKRKRVRIITTYQRVPYVRRFISYAGKTEEVTATPEADVKKIRESFPEAQEWTQESKRLNTRTFAWNVICEKKDNIRAFDKDAKFPIQMAVGYRTRSEEKPEPYGLVKQHMDPQREVNKRRSKMLHQLNTAQTWFEGGAFGGEGEDESKARSEASRPDGWIKFRTGFKVERVTHQELAAAQFQLLQEAKREIDESGINEELEGESKAQSGKEFQLRLKEGLKSIREIMSNIRACRRRVAEYWLDEILLEAERAAKANGQEFTLRKYDVVIEEAPDAVNLQSETFAALADLVQGGLPIPPDILIEVSPLAPKYKSAILQRWKDGGGVPPAPQGKATK